MEPTLVAACFSETVVRTATWHGVWRPILNPRTNHHGASEASTNAFRHSHVSARFRHTAAKFGQVGLAARSAGCQFSAPRRARACRLHGLREKPAPVTAAHSENALETPPSGVRRKVQLFTYRRNCPAAGGCPAVVSRNSGASSEPVLDRPSKRAQNTAKKWPFGSARPGVGPERHDQGESAAMAVHRRQSANRACRAYAEVARNETVRLAVFLRVAPRNGKVVHTIGFPKIA